MDDAKVAWCTCLLFFAICTRLKNEAHFLDVMQSLKVVHCLTSLDFGGVEKHMEILADASRSGGMIHSFVAINRGGAAAKALIDIGMQVDCLHKSASIPNLFALISLYRFFRKVRPTVVHTHGAEANFHGLLAARLAGVPVRIGEEIGIPQHRTRAKWVFRQTYRTALRVIGISDAVTRWLVDSGEVPAEKAMRLYNPVRLPAYLSSVEKSPNIFRIGFVGRLEPVKNPLVLVDACALLIAKGIPAELCIVGDGSQRSEIESRIKELNLVQHVCLHGYQKNPEHFMRECNVYVQPSISEGFGLALVEAMGYGLPVIATSVGGAPEIISDSKNGWLLNEATPNSVALALQRAFEYGPEMLLDIGNEARISVLDRFVPSDYLQHLEFLYQSLLVGDKCNLRHE